MLLQVPRWCFQTLLAPILSFPRVDNLAKFKYMGDCFNFNAEHPGTLIFTYMHGYDYR